MIYQTSSKVHTLTCLRSLNPGSGACSLIDGPSVSSPVSVKVIPCLGDTVGLDV